MKNMNATMHTTKAGDPAFFICPLVEKENLEARNEWRQIARAAFGNRWTEESFIHGGYTRTVFRHPQRASKRAVEIALQEHSRPDETNFSLN